jgi:kynurenine formamidase
MQEPRFTMCDGRHMRITKIVDLSHPVDSETQVYPGDPVVRFEQHSTVSQ